MMTFRCVRGAWLLAFVLTTGAAVGQQPMTPDRQAEVVLTAARKAYNDGDLPFAAQRFQEVLAKFGNTPQANAARYGLALCLINGPQQDLAKAMELLAAPAGDGGFSERGPALYQLAVCHRALGLKELEKPANTPQEQQQRKQAADPRFAQAVQAFSQARDWFAGKKVDDQAARCRCDIAEMELRLGKVKEARATCEPFAKDAALAKSPARPLGLYYHGLACFLDRDLNTAGRSLNQLAPFTDPAFGTHARYLVGRVLHLSGENAEASVHYDGVLSEFDRARKDAVQALTQPDRFKNNPFEKARLESLAKGPPPEYVAGAAFHGGCLAYEAGKFPDALVKFQAFAKDFPLSPLQPDALLRTGFCLVQLRQYDEAVKLLAPLPEKTPRLSDQALLWLGKAQVGIAQSADPNNPADRDNKVKAAIATLKTAADRAGQMPNDPDAKGRRHEILFEMADALQSAKQYAEAASVYEQLWNEQGLPARRDEVLQRLASARGSAGQLDPSNQRCDEFRRLFPQSVLMPAVAYQQAENSFARAAELAKNRAAPSNELRLRFDEAAAKFREVVTKYPEFERANHARYGLGVCLSRLEDLDGAVKAFESIPAGERIGELALAAYLLADCLIRQAPAKAEDALAENQLREKLTAAAGLLDGFTAANPKSPEAPAALLKLGYCTRRLGSTLADANERSQTLNRAREVYDKLMREHPQSPFAVQGRLEQAKVKALVGDKGGAMNDLRQFSQNPELVKSPTAPLAALHLAALHREQNQPAEAVKVLDEARKRHEPELAKDPERAEWLHLLKYHHAVAHFESGKPDEARVLFDQVVQQAAGKPIAAEAALLSGKSRLAEAKKQIESATQLRNQAGSDKGKQAAAEQQLKKAQGVIRETADTLVKRADSFKTALPDHEARARMYYDAAWAYRDLADDRSPAAYKKLIDEFPDNALAVDARFELAEQLAQKNQHDEAIKLLKDALDREPLDRPVPLDTLDRIRLRLGASLAAKKEHAAAANQFEVVAANPKSPYVAQALYRAGDCLCAAGEFAKAAEKLAVFRDKPEFHNRDGVSDRAMLRLGQALAGAKQWDASRQAYETMIQRFGAGNPLAIEARYGIAWTLQHQNRFDEAVNAYQQVIAATQSETAARAQLQIGQCRLAQKKYAEAASAFLVVPYTYDYPELTWPALLEAARTFADAGQPEPAAKLLQKILKDAPKDSDWSKAAAERLGKLKK